MKKGFTLIELVGLILILGVISIITVPIVNSSIKNSKEKLYKEQVGLIIEAAQKWSVKHAELLPDSSDEDYQLEILTILHEGLLEQKNGALKNPKDGTNMRGCVLIKYESEYQQYTYEYKDLC